MALCPASVGQTGLVLLPFGPWQPKHTAALAVPPCTVPWSYGVAAGAAGAFASHVASIKPHAPTTMFLFDIVAFPHPIDLCDGGKLYTTVRSRLTAPDRA